MADNLQGLMERLGYTFRDAGLLKKALTHSSYANEGRHGLQSNERLEFLGDSVLGLVAANYLFRRETGPEGELTKRGPPSSVKRPCALMPGSCSWETACCWAKGSGAPAARSGPPYWRTLLKR